MMTDPIADMLTRIRNANKAHFDKVVIPSSKVKVAIAQILKDEGYIRDFTVEADDKQGILQVHMKYGPKGEQVIHSLRRISKPSIRRYVGKDEIPRVRNGLGRAIMSTSRGIVTDGEARKLGVGGEVICAVW